MRSLNEIRLFLQILRMLEFAHQYLARKYTDLTYNISKSTSKIYKIHGQILTRFTSNMFEKYVVNIRHRDDEDR